MIDHVSMLHRVLATRGINWEQFIIYWLCTRTRRNWTWRFPNSCEKHTIFCWYRRAITTPPKPSDTLYRSRGCRRRGSICKCSISTKFDPSSSTFFRLDSFLDDVEIFLVWPRKWCAWKVRNSVVWKWPRSQVKHEPTATATHLTLSHTLYRTMCEVSWSGGDGIIWIHRRQTSAVFGKE